MAVSPNLTGEERAGRGGALPADLQGHHGAQAAHRGGLQGRPQQVCQVGQVGDQVEVSAGLATLQSGHQQGHREAIKPHFGKNGGVQLLDHLDKRPSWLYQGQAFEISF